MEDDGDETTMEFMCNVHEPLWQREPVADWHLLYYCEYNEVAMNIWRCIDCDQTINFLSFAKRASQIVRLSLPPFVRSMSW